MPLFHSPGSIYRVFSRDVTEATLVSLNKETAAILVSLNKGTSAMLVSPTNPQGIELYDYANQEHMCRSLHVHYVLESIFARIFPFLELTLQQETHIYIHLHQFAQFSYIAFASFVFVRQRLYSDWPF